MLYPNVEVRHLHAVIVLAEELNFTRAAIRLNICQPALSKQMAELEKGLGFPLFLRQRKKIIDLSEPGRVFVEEARSAVLHAERAVHMARSISHGSETVLTVGPFTFCRSSMDFNAIGAPSASLSQTATEAQESICDGFGSRSDFRRTGFGNCNRAAERSKNHCGGLRSHSPLRGFAGKPQSGSQESGKAARPGRRYLGFV